MQLISRFTLGPVSVSSSYSSAVVVNCGVFSMGVVDRETGHCHSAMVSVTAQDFSCSLINKNGAGRPS